jgi:hypothetical protein
LLAHYQKQPKQTEPVELVHHKMTAVRFIRVWPSGENLTPNPRRKNSLLNCLGGVSHKKYQNMTTVLRTILQFHYVTQVAQQTRREFQIKKL